MQNCPTGPQDHRPEGGPLDPEEFTDRYEDALRALIEEKKRGHKLTRVEEPEDTTKLVDLMTASLSRPAARRTPHRCICPTNRTQ
jgi:DNA end-binding protein Ku